MDSRDEHGSGLKPIFAGSGLDRTAIFSQLADQDWIGLRKLLLFYVIILKIPKILVAIHFTGLLNGSVYFAIKCKNSAGIILQFELYPPLFTYNVEF